jgi:hypothetical protein
VLVLAAAVTESWLETGAVPDTVTVAGLKLQLLFAGSPEQAKVTWPEKPAAPETFIGAVTALPALTVSVVLPLSVGVTTMAASTTWLSVVEEGWVLVSPG